MRLFLIVTCLAAHSHGFGFIYEDFNHTDGLVFNGIASTSSCEELQGASELNQPGYGYSQRHGNWEADETVEALHESVDVVVEEVVTTQGRDDDIVRNGLQESTAGFGHRDDGFFGGFAGMEKEDCAVRLKLTSAEPARSGSIWRRERVNVLQGFSTKFTFKISALSKSCSIVRDASFSARKYESCVVHGGDGFAFVVQSDEHGLSALGKGAEQLGYGGLKNALGVEFDIWYNPELGDTLEDHVTIVSKGSEPLSSGLDSQLHIPQIYPLADGKYHTARIVYYPFVNNDLVPHLKYNQNGQPFMKDNGEGYRLGMLAVWMDNMTDPLVAIPINFSVLLDLPEDKALVGFTAATGRSWASHDIISWSFCETYDAEDCQ